jgi:magnesium transporter
MAHPCRCGYLLNAVTMGRRVTTMTRIIKKRSKKVGLPPGSLIYIGEKAHIKPKVTIIEYDEENYLEKEVTSFAECVAYKNKPGVTWINVEGIHNIANLEKLGECFNLHPLVMEDILNTDQRPKMEDFTDYLYLVLKILHYHEETKETEAEQISLILGSNYVVSFYDSDGEVFNAVRERVKAGIGRIRKSGADYLAYTLLDLIVDKYFLILEQLGEVIEFFEEELVTNPSPKTLQNIHKLKLAMIMLRKSIWPLREVISKLQRRESPLIAAATGIYLKDVYDHAIQVIDTIETFRDMLSGMVDIYLSSVSNRLNETMKVLTIIATIFIPLTFISGVYGMNFKHMPELDWAWGYPLILLLMATVALGLLAYFRRKKWIGS